MIPKVGTASDVYAIDMLCTQIETAKGRKKRVGFEMIIETALGMQNVHEIAAASKRNESLHFGVADYAASTKARTTNIGGANADYAVLTETLGEVNARPIGVTCGITQSPGWWWPHGQMAFARLTGHLAIFPTRMLSALRNTCGCTGLRRQVGHPSLAG